jgi:hypothetical protein
MTPFSTSVFAYRMLKREGVSTSSLSALRSSSRYLSTIFLPRSRHFDSCREASSISLSHRVAGPLVSASLAVSTWAKRYAIALVMAVAWSAADSVFVVFTQRPRPG